MFSTTVTKREKNKKATADRKWEWRTRVLLAVCRFLENMNFLEKDLETIIWENAQTTLGRKMLAERGFKLSGLTLRQVNLGSYGVIDLLNIQIKPTWDGLYKRIFKIIELKKEEVNAKTLLQACRYITGLEQHLEQVEEDKISKEEYEIILIGATVDSKSDFAFLYNEMPYVNIYTYKYELQGIRFELQEKGWHQINQSLCRDTINTLSKPGYRLLKRMYIPPCESPIELPF